MACNALAQPITSRDRRIAGLLLVSIAEFIRRGWRAVRNHPIATAVACCIIAGAALTTYALLPQESESGPGRADKAPSVTTVAAAPRPTAATNAGIGGPATTVAAAPASAELTDAETTPGAAPACPSPAPLHEVDPSRALGCPFAPTTLTVTEVTADEGFWATTATQELIWIHLVGQGESPFDIEPGQQLSVAGRISAPQTQPTEMGLPAEGHPRAAALAYYVEVAYSAVSVAT